MTNDTAVLPPDCEADFIGEGAANVVFHVRCPRGHAAFPGRLLRVPKAGTSAYSHDELQHYWQDVVAPLFSESQLVRQSLVSLTGSGIVAKLNAILAKNEAARRKDFQGSKVDDAEHGMLVEDMRSQNPTDKVIEFKPKWLSQSCAAPPTASRCRNCAREAYRANKNGDTLGSSDRWPLCPLKLIHARDMACGHEGEDDPDCEFCTTVTSLLLGSGDRANQSLIQSYKPQLSRWIRTNELLPRLQSLQVALETSLDTDQELNMTLRDCTCFLRIRADPRQPLEAKLGDLDRKNGSAKREYWDEMERKLAEGGYYEGREQPRQRTACWLERRS